MAEGGGNRRQSLPRKLTMEYYFDFIHSHKQLDLTVPHLTQIIDMQGFRKTHGTYKSDLVEAVKTMVLMDPSRSTLGDASISSDAFISLGDLIKDIKELQWQECCITSMQTINAVDHDQLQHEMSNDQSPALAIVASTPTAKPRRQRKKLKKLAGINGHDVGCGDPAASSTIFDFGGSQRASCMPFVMKFVPSKRRVKHIYSDPIGNRGDGNMGVSAISVTDSQPLESSSAFLANEWY